VVMFVKIYGRTVVVPHTLLRCKIVTNANIRHPLRPGSGLALTGNVK
jgi:hypothetical protein